VTDLSPEAVAQMVADREAGTPGPWVYEYTCVGHTVRQPGAMNRIFGSNNANAPEVDARRIARLPDLEAAYLTLAAENATLRADADRINGYNVELCRDFNVMNLHGARQDDLIRALRASEAAAMDRVTAALEIAKTRHIPDQPAAYGGSELEWAQRQYASLRRDIIAALTPTADKEPKT